MLRYSLDQLGRYFTLLSISEWETRLSNDARAFFDHLVKRQLSRMTYNTLSLHYSNDKSGSLDPLVLHDKLVDRDRGGYCFELNVFFLHVIRSLGFQAMAVGCRMRDRKSTSEGLDRWRTTSHMAILVLIDGERFLIDVGCGVDSPVTPLLLTSGQMAVGLTDQELKVEFKKLAPTAMGSPVWIYSMRYGVDAPWQEIYAFADAEFLPSDFDVLNYYTLNASPFTRLVIVQTVFFAEDGRSGTRLLVNDRFRECISNKEETSVMLKTEDERVQAFKDHFGITLSQDELDAMKDSPHRLPDQS